MEPREIRDIAISAAVLAFIFVYQGIGQLAATLLLLPIGILTVSTSFVLHELGHRTFARKYKFHAEYRMWPQGLLLAVLLAIASSGTFFFAAPGAVVIMPKADLWGRFRPLSRRTYGIISAMGPAVNIILAAAFAAAALLTGIGVLWFGASINAWLAFFNLLPIGPLDGTKVLAWNKLIWVALVATAAAMLIAVQII
ncbi:MAG: M50 family metallopeptidase [Candidatus Aenigmatarchaeota archaeon]